MHWLQRGLHSPDPEILRTASGQQRHKEEEERGTQHIQDRNTGSRSRGRLREEEYNNHGASGRARALCTSSSFRIVLENVPTEDMTLDSRSSHFASAIADKTPPSDQV